MNPVLETAFGNRTAAWTLLFLAAYDEGQSRTDVDRLKRQTHQTD